MQGSTSVMGLKLVCSAPSSTFCAGHGLEELIQDHLGHASIFTPCLCGLACAEHNSAGHRHRGASGRCTMSGVLIS